VFEEFAQMIQQRYPGLNIVGDNYPPPAVRQILATCISFIKFAILAVVAMGINPFTQFFNIPAPSWYQYALDNKIYFCLMVFFLTNAIEGQMYSTGAFEVHYNDVLVWSKIKSGRVPSPQELMQIIDNHQRFDRADNPMVA
jgi:thioredoxin reductase-like selenoprotein T